MGSNELRAKAAFLFEQRMAGGKGRAPEHGLVIGEMPVGHGIVVRVCKVNNPGKTSCYYVLFQLVRVGPGGDRAFLASIRLFPDNLTQLGDIVAQLIDEETQNQFEWQRRTDAGERE
jgi:hypothetical protein